MNILTLAAFVVGEAAGVKGILLQLLVIALVIMAVYGLIRLIEYCFAPLPNQAKVVIAVILVILVLAWAIMTFL